MNYKSLVRVESGDHHLLFKYNSVDRQIEIMVLGGRGGKGKDGMKGQTWIFPVDDLLGIDGSERAVEAKLLRCPSCNNAWKMSRLESGACLNCGAVWEHRRDIESGTSKFVHKTPKKERYWRDERKRFE